ncbi:MAG: AAA family ATPase [Thalassospira sp.]|nr:AAA family ATPase [Thalassospira sp.]
MTENSDKLSQNKTAVYMRLAKLCATTEPNLDDARLLPLPDETLAYYIKKIIGKPKEGEDSWEKYAEKYHIIRQWYDARPRLSIVSGPSGSGKGRVSAVMAASLQAEGYTVYYFGETAAAQAALKRSLKGIEATRLDSPENLDRAELAILVVDEYTQCEPQHLANIATALEQNPHLIVVFAGDEQQFANPFMLGLDQVVPCYRLITAARQKGALLDAANFNREANIAAALAVYKTIDYDAAEVGFSAPLNYGHPPETMKATALKWFNDMLSDRHHDVFRTLFTEKNDPAAWLKIITDDAAMAESLNSDLIKAFREKFPDMPIDDKTRFIDTFEDSQGDTTVHALLLHTQPTLDARAFYVGMGRAKECVIMLTTAANEAEFLDRIKTDDAFLKTGAALQLQSGQLRQPERGR